jgi:hypothetical protein
MGPRRHTRDSHYSVEGIRDHEVLRLFSKLSLSLEQTEAIENRIRSLVDELVHGPIVEPVVRVQLPNELAASEEERLRGREGVQVARAQWLRPL